jgi:hypothetical protein
MFLIPSQVKKFSQHKLRDKKHQHFSTVSLPTDSVIVDHAVFRTRNLGQHFLDISKKLCKPGISVINK